MFSQFMGWIWDIIYLAGAIDTQKFLEKKPADYEGLGGYRLNLNMRGRSEAPQVIEAAKTVCQFLKDKKLINSNANKVTVSISQLKAYLFSYLDSPNVLQSADYDQLCEFIAKFFKMNNMKVDISELSDKDWVIVRKLRANDCIEDNSTITAATTASSNIHSSQSSQKTTANNLSGSNKVSATTTFKNLGPLSANLSSILDNTNKQFASGTYVYWIFADSPAENNRNSAYIEPLDLKDGTMYPRQYATQVRFGFASQRNKFILFFFDKNEAELFKNDCIAKYGHKYSNIRVMYTKADRRGYYGVKTSFGLAYIRAERLNES